MKRYLSWSGGKDSSASIVLCYENGIPLDGVIFSEVMFDHSRNISGENPEHIEWIYNTAIPIIERMGYSVNVVRAEKDYVGLFHTRITRSKQAERIGKKYGFPLGGMCFVNSQLKVGSIKKFQKHLDLHESVIGIAYDEPERLSRLKENSVSVLAQYKVCERDTYELCRRYNLLSPLYESKSRGGCWFCPNCSVKEFARLKKYHPELWDELEKLSHDPDIVKQGFKYARTFASVNREVDLINNQISIFEYMKEQHHVEL
ncbi:MAG: phosphoadenosine phosphosulfate reductase [Clostridia bacterium]|nr:phosphoadenosine phosphosulfate reductase [Clostridia bacterium]